MAENLSRIPVDMQKMLDKVLRLFKKVPRIVAVEGKIISRSHGMTRGSRARAWKNGLQGKNPGRHPRKRGKDGMTRTRDDNCSSRTPLTREVPT